jgi:outer membrane cobalamin receptor
MSFRCRFVGMGMLVVASFVAVTASAQTAPGEEPSPEEMLLRIAEETRLVTIASKKAVAPREAPGIVTVVTADEIEAMGARDLIDVLRQVPGLDFGVDVQGVVGLGVRGNWAHEGKALLMIDGQEVNEPLYASLHFGNEFPVSLIERIEIVRGPGSAIYGGYGELAVINIVTKQVDGVQVTLTDGEMSGVNGRRRIELAWGRSSGATRISVLGSLASGNRSDAVYTDGAGESFDMADNSKLDQEFLSVTLSHRNYQGRVVVDRYETTARDEYGLNLEKAVGVDFDTVLLELQAVYQPAPNLSITPRINVRRQEPWRQTSTVGDVYDKTVERRIGNVTLNWEPSSRLSVVAGAEYFTEHATTPEDSLFPFEGGATSVDHDNLAMFGELTTSTRIGVVSAAARWENHSVAGTSFVPRFALTRVAGKAHFKLLASRAFRAPSIENFSSAPDVEPETTRVFEVEAGYRPAAGVELVANAFDTKLDDVIVYSYDVSDGTEHYANLGSVSTRGVELEGRVRRGRATFTGSYSYYRNRDNEVEAYAVPQDDQALRAFPNHKIALRATLPVGARWTVTPSLVHYSTRYGVGVPDADGALEVNEFEPVTLANLFVNIDDVGLPGLTVGAGVFDLLGENHVFLQPYDAAHPPYPDATREFVVKLSYRTR